jgi:hypothetical protein
MVTWIVAVVTHSKVGKPPLLGWPSYFAAGLVIGGLLLVLAVMNDWWPFTWRKRQRGVPQDPTSGSTKRTDSKVVPSQPGRSRVLRPRPTISSADVPTRDDLDEIARFSQREHARILRTIKDLAGWARFFNQQDEGGDS